MSEVSIKQTDREGYFGAWRQMCKNHPEGADQIIADGVHPLSNKPLKTEVGGGFWIASIDDEPVGLFSMLITSTGRTIGKQFAVLPEFQRMGIGGKLVDAAEQWLRDQEIPGYYIGCSEKSAALLIKRGNQPYATDRYGIIKFNIKL